MNTNRARSRASRLLLPWLCSLPLLAATACTSDEEKMLHYDEEVTALIDANKSDCDAMATALTKYAETDGKDARKLKAKLAKTPEEKKALQARIDAKFPERSKALEAKAKAGMKCLFTSEKVALAMMQLQGDGEDQPDRAPPERPSTGAPVAIVVDKLGASGLSISVYNFGEERAAGYDVMIHYVGADGATIVPDPKFSHDVDLTSFSGSSYAVPPKQWRSFVLDHLKVPAGAARAEILATGVRAMDGVKITRSLWQFTGDTWSWPKK